MGEEARRLADAGQAHPIADLGTQVLPELGVARGGAVVQDQRAGGEVGVERDGLGLDRNLGGGDFDRQRPQLREGADLAERAAGGEEQQAGGDDAGGWHGQGASGNRRGFTRMRRSMGRAARDVNLRRGEGGRRATVRVPWDPIPGWPASNGIA